MTTRIGLVSDTHDNMPLTRQAAAFFREEAGVDVVLHLGDVTRPAVVQEFAGLPARFLVGNNDDPRELDVALREAGLPASAPAWRDDIEGVRVGATHGHLATHMRTLAAEVDVLAHGHTHRRVAQRQANVLVVNPGALHRARVRTLAILTLPDPRVAFFEVRETGVRPLRRA